MLPLFDYLDIIWCRATKTKLKELDILYKKTAKIALNYDMQESSVKVGGGGQPHFTSFGQPKKAKLG